MIKPKPLTPGDTVAILATSGPCNPEKLTKGINTIKSMGLVPIVMDSCYHQHGGYLAGEDWLRLKNIHTAFAMPKVCGIFAARGGYGAARLLPKLDYELITNNPKIFVGYSDVTALHIALNQRCKLITYHGPMPAADFGCEVNPYTLNSLKQMIFSDDIAIPSQLNNSSTSLDKPLITIVPGHATGPLIGGNLSILASLIGTPYEPDTRGCILFLEETNEPPYIIDRLLLQLKQSGKLKDAAGIILGDFSPESYESLYIPINELITTEGKPTIAGLVCGHTSPTLTLPLGHVVELDASSAANMLLCTQHHITS